MNRSATLIVWKRQGRDLKIDMHMPYVSDYFPFPSRTAQRIRYDQMLSRDLVAERRSPCMRCDGLEKQHLIRISSTRNLN